MPLTQVQGGMILPSTTLTTPIVATTMGVGGATPAASGAGITFPATQSASTDANTLDDYEEGTWTPSFTGSSSNPTVTYGSYRNGWYIKVGKQVTAWLQLSTTASTGGSGNLRISGLPFTSSSNGNHFQAGNVGTVFQLTHSSNYLQFGCRVNPNTTWISLFEFGILNSSGGDSELPVSALPNTSTFQTISVSYITD